MISKGNIEVKDGHIKVRWLLSLAQRKATDINVPEKFPRYQARRLSECLASVPLAK